MIDFDLELVDPIDTVASERGYFTITWLHAGATMRTALGPLMLRLVAGRAAADREDQYLRTTLEKTRQQSLGLNPT